MIRWAASSMCNNICLEVSHSVALLAPKNHPTWTQSEPVHAHTHRHTHVRTYTNTHTLPSNEACVFKKKCLYSVRLTDVTEIQTQSWELSTYCNLSNQTKVIT